MEDEYWAKNGEPKVLKPYLVKSSVPGREDITRKSWIYIMYEKDKMITKKEDLDWIFEIKLNKNNNKKFMKSILKKFKNLIKVIYIYNIIPHIN